MAEMRKFKNEIAIKDSNTWRLIAAECGGDELAMDKARPFWVLGATEVSIACFQVSSTAVMQPRGTQEGIHEEGTLRGAEGPNVRICTTPRPSPWHLLFP